MTDVAECGGAVVTEVMGECPECGSRYLLLGSGGYVTCGYIPCPDPSAASEALNASKVAEHERKVREL